MEFKRFCLKSHTEDILSILNEFNILYNTLIDSAQDLERIFKSALNVYSIYNKDKGQKLKLENVHIEHFTKLIIKDTFTQVILYVTSLGINFCCKKHSKRKIFKIKRNH